MNSKLTKTFLILVVSLIGIYAFAEESAEAAHHEGGIPRIVYIQAFNFFGLLAIFYFLLRKKVSGFFATRHETLKVAVNESRRLKEEVEKKHQDYLTKLQSLEKTGAETLEKIKKDGESLKARIIQEAVKASSLIEKEALKTIEHEISKAKKILFEEALDFSLDGAKAILEKNIAPADQERLQKEFVARVGKVQ